MLYDFFVVVVVVVLVVVVVVVVVEVVVVVLVVFFIDFVFVICFFVEFWLFDVFDNLLLFLVDCDWGFLVLFMGNGSVIWGYFLFLKLENFVVCLVKVGFDVNCVK